MKRVKTTPRVHLVPSGTMPQATTQVRPNAKDARAVQAACIPQTIPRFNHGVPRARSTGGNAFVYQAAKVWGFRYPAA